MPKKIVTVGDLVVDLVLEVELPAVIDEHQMSPTLLFEPGGAATTILAARHMGLEVAAIGTVGTDLQGQILKKVLDDTGVDTSALDIPEKSTTTTIIALNDGKKNGHVFLGHYGQGSDIGLTDSAKQKLTEADAVFIPGYTAVEERLQPLVQEIFPFITSQKIPLYFDVGPFLGQLSHDKVQSILQSVDVLFLKDDEIPFVIEDKTGVEACRALLAQYENMMIVLKTGASGCQIMTHDDTIICKGYTTKVVDTIGAGDAFAGAFMSAHLEGLPLEACGYVANAMGAASVQKTGAGRNVPTRQEVQAILDSNWSNIRI